MTLVTFKKIAAGVVDVYLTNTANPIGRISINKQNRRWDLWLNNIRVLRNATTLGQAKNLMQAILIASGRADNLSDDTPNITSRSRSIYERTDEHDTGS